MHDQPAGFLEDSSTPGRELRYRPTDAQAQALTYGLHNIVSTFSVPCPFDERIARESLQLLLERHDILRSVLPFDDPTADASILTEVAVELDHYDVLALGLTPEETESLQRDWDAALRILRLRKIDKTRFPLFRLHVLVSEPTSFQIAGIFSHAIFDGKSSAIFEREFSEIYAAAIDHRDAVLPPIEMTFSEWARISSASEFSASPEVRSQYWKEVLANITYPLPESAPESDRSDAPMKRFSYRLVDEEFAQWEAMVRDVGVRQSTVAIARTMRALEGYGHGPNRSLVAVLDTRPLSRLRNSIGIFSWLGLVQIPATAGTGIFEAIENSIRDNLDHSPMPDGTNLLGEPFVLLNYQANKRPEEDLAPGERIDVPFGYDMTGIALDSLAIDIYRSAGGIQIRIGYSTAHYATDTIETIVESIAKGPRIVPESAKHAERRLS